MSSTYQAKRTLRRDGIVVDLYRFEVVSSSSRGDHVEPVADAPQPIATIPDPGGKSLSYGVFGVDVDADMTYLVADDVELDDGGGEGASRIVQDGETFVVIDADSTQQHGFSVLECERDTESDLV